MCEYGQGLTIRNQKLEEMPSQTESHMSLINLTLTITHLTHLTLLELI